MLLFCSMYCAFLNTGGRILFDAIIAKTQNQDEFLVDVDSRVSGMARKHLSLYKVRRKLSISVSECDTVYAVFRGGEDVLDHVVCGHTTLTTRSPEVGSTFCDGGAVEDSTVTGLLIFYYFNSIKKITLINNQAEN